MVLGSLDQEVSVTLESNSSPAETHNSIIRGDDGSTLYHQSLQYLNPWGRNLIPKKLPRMPTVRNFWKNFIPLIRQVISEDLIFRLIFFLYPHLCLSFLILYLFLLLILRENFFFYFFLFLLILLYKQLYTLLFHEIT